MDDCGSDLEHLLIGLVSSCSPSHGVEAVINGHFGYEKSILIARARSSLLYQHADVLNEALLRRAWLGAPLRATADAREVRKSRIERLDYEICILWERVVADMEERHLTFVSISS